MSISKLIVDHETELLDKLLIQIGSRKSSIETTDSDNRTPLIRASIIGSERLVKKLFPYNPSVNAQDYVGRTALYYAAQEHYLSVAKLLIEKNADPNIQDRHGNTPLHVAVSQCRGSGEMIILLRAHGAKDDLSNNHGVTPVAWAKRVAKFDIAKFFS